MLVWRASLATALLLSFTHAAAAQIVRIAGTVKDESGRPIYRDIAARVPVLTTVYLRVGELYEQQPDVERALEAYRRLTALEPDNADVRAAIGRLTKQ